MTLRVDPLWYLGYHPNIRGSSEPPRSFDYSQGRVFLHEGTIFYSPNCNRPVIIPPRTPHISNPFGQPRLNASDFKQAVWWTEVWGWLSFIPLSPSFTSTPFAPFSWTPRIDRIQVSFTSASGEEQKETRFKMFEDDIWKWKKAEELVVEAARHIQLFFGILGNSPPKPSSFHYDRPHKSLGVAKRMTTVSRDWFIVWMGFISYLISQVELCPPGRHHPLDESSPLPDWYKCLKDVFNYSDSWLDGLASSSVCSFDLRTPRAGIVFPWVEKDKHRPPIDWFYTHHVPLWFTWTSAEERAIRSDSSLAYLEPPVALVQEALTLLFAAPEVTLPALVLKKYFQLRNDNPIDEDILDTLRLENAPSFVFNFTEEQFMKQLSRGRQTKAAPEALKALVASRKQENRAAAEAAVSFPSQGMVESSQVESKGKLFNHYDDFFSAREKRQAELIRVESSQNRQRRESRARDMPIKSATMYIWERVQSSGGRDMYMRVQVNKKRNEDVYSQFRRSERLYNAQSNEWDFSEEFSFPAVAGQPDSDSDFEDESMYDEEPYQFLSEDVIHRSPSPPPPTDHIMETVPSPSYSRNPQETLKLLYGYTVPLVDMEESKESKEYPWESVLKTLGFVQSLDELSVSKLDERAIRIFFSQIIKDCTVTPHLYDLNAANYSPLCDLFKFADVHRPSEDLFVFSSPRSMSCEWVLGVHSATAALYVCRYILENPQAHTFVTIAHRLLERGIRFRTLLALRCSPRQLSISQPYTPSSRRPSTYEFTVSDFETAMLNCQAILSSPQGRAALLQAGIVGRIAKEYLSVDGVLAGPSVEVTLHCVGYIASSGSNGLRYCDDELTENEVAIICGTYTMYTALQQESVRSWFPLPSAWYANRSGVRWPDWTERCEDVFNKLLADNHKGKGKPRTQAEWVSYLRGHKFTRGLVDNSESRAQAFMNQVVPIH